MYGLRERLAKIPIDDESRKIVLERLLGASNKMREGLVQRTDNLEQRV